MPTEPPPRLSGQSPPRLATPSRRRIGQASRRPPSMKGRFVRESRLHRCASYHSSGHPLPYDTATNFWCDLFLAIFVAAAMMQQQKQNARGGQQKVPRGTFVMDGNVIGTTHLLNCRQRARRRGDDRAGDGKNRRGRATSSYCRRRRRNLWLDDRGVAGLGAFNAPDRDRAGRVGRDRNGRRRRGHRAAHPLFQSAARHR